jgi:hypothetical protein
MARTKRGPLRIGGSAVAGALTGLALIAIIWGAAWALPAPPGADEEALAGSTAEPAPPSSEPRTAPASPRASKDPSRSASPSTSADTQSVLGAAPKTPVKATVTYQVAAKGAVGTDVEAFARAVKRYFDDPRGWRSAGVAFERVEEGGQITVWIAEPATVPSFSSICSTNLSCSISTNIIINVERWLNGALPGAMDDVRLDDYRKMVVNHEVGHWLGHHDHTFCGGPGELAPLMMQQSKGLEGCLFNPYPLDSELTAPDLF